MVANGEPSWQGRRLAKHREALYTGVSRTVSNFIAATHAKGNFGSTLCVQWRVFDALPPHRHLQNWRLMLHLPSCVQSWQNPDKLGGHLTAWLATHTQRYSQP